jgi:hypothetical protein
MWKSDPGAEPIIIEKLEKKSFCFYCKKEMLKHGHTLECPICGHHYTEKVTHQ